MRNYQILSILLKPFQWVSKNGWVNKIDNCDNEMNWNHRSQRPKCLDTFHVDVCAYSHVAGRHLPVMMTRTGLVLGPRFQGLEISLLFFRRHVEWSIWILCIWSLLTHVLVNIMWLIILSPRTRKVALCCIRRYHILSSVLCLFPAYDEDSWFARLWNEHKWTNWWFWICSESWLGVFCLWFNDMCN